MVWRHVGRINMDRIILSSLFLLLTTSLDNAIGEKLDPEATKLQDDYFKWRKQTWPLYYHRLGYNELAGRLDDVSIETFEAIWRKCDHFAGRAKDLLQRKGASVLGVREKRYVKLVQFETELCTSDRRGHLFPQIAFRRSVVNGLTQTFSTNGILKLANLQDHRVAIKTLRQIPRYIDQTIELARVAVRRGYTFPNESMSGIEKQYARLDTTPEATDFYVPFKNLKGTSPSVVAIQKEALQVIRDEVLPAFKKLKNYVQNEYIRHLRPKIGLSSLPDGEKLYQSFLEFHTTIKGITPEEVHNTGLEEVRRLKKGMMQVAQDLGYRNHTFKQFVEAIKSDPAQFFASRDECLDFYKSTVNDILPKLDTIFEPRLINDYTKNLNVEPVPPAGSGLAYYRGASFDGRRKGAFFINLEKLDALKKFETVSLTLHEGNPGHHLQNSFNNISPMPEFIQYSLYAWPIPSVPPSYTSHVEGWGLYAEFLGNEMGMFEDNNQKVGFYSWNLLRACRLVVDTGMHVFGWSRDRAIEFLLQNTAMSRHSVVGQIDRYITSPGQATAYKIGELRIRQLRESRQKELGSKFDLRAFHRHVLTCKGPMEMLEECVKEEEQLPFPVRKPRRRESQDESNNSSTSSAITASISINLSTSLTVAAVTSMVSFGIVGRARRPFFY